jgi:hypothetical protein
VILTTGDLAEGAAVVRRMSDGEERRVRLDEWIGDR